MPEPDCRFCAIAAGDEQGHVVFEDDISLAFLDHRPLFPGHSLLIPRRHLETVWDLPDDLIGPLFANARLLSAAIRDAMGATGAFIAVNNVVSQSVPHLHIHLVPRNRKDGLRGFFWPRRRYDGEEHMRETAAAVRAAVGVLAQP
ncbi:MAG TPA: HIT family protein [Solirubrobacterales bacterium]|nr:HIT family protein [Solirubrobacterales bacterium]